MKDYGKSLKVWLLQNDWSVVEAANYMNISKSHLYLIIRGERNPGRLTKHLIKKFTNGEINFP
jgi:hypothetical protein